MIVKRSDAGHRETLSRLLAEFERRELTVFARIDHAGAARDAGLELSDEVVLLSGNPQTGTPLMRSDPRIGIELPLRILVWQQGDEVLIGYRDPRELADAYDVAEHRPTLERMANLLAELALEAGRPLSSR